VGWGGEFCLGWPDNRGDWWSLIQCRSARFTQYARIAVD
jgi:hypothetical protein